MRPQNGRRAACTRGREHPGPGLFRALFLGLIAVSVGGAREAAGPGEGEQAARVCGTCHSLEAGAAHKIGPNLWEIVGSAIGSKPGFTYSPALASRTGRWNQQSLDRFLADPQGFVPGNRMPYPGIPDPAVRAAVIGYLSTLSDSPQETNSQPSAGATEAPGNDYGGLAEDPARALVYYACSACHSIHLVKQQGLSHGRWQETLDWMVEEQGMDPLPPEELQQVLEYLAEYYGEDRKATQR